MDVTTGDNPRPMLHHFRELPLTNAFAFMAMHWVTCCGNPVWWFYRYITLWEQGLAEIWFGNVNFRTNQFCLLVGREMHLQSLEIRFAKILKRFQGWFLAIYFCMEICALQLSCRFRHKVFWYLWLGAGLLTLLITAKQSIQIKIVW